MYVGYGIGDGGDESLAAQNAAANADRIQRAIRRCLLLGSRPAFPLLMLRTAVNRIVCGDESRVHAGAREPAQFTA
jgi:hypothetical protein